MRRSIGLVTLGAALALLWGGTALAQTSAPNSQHQKMTTCNADAKAKGLTGADRTAFMKTCLSGKSEAATTGTSAGATSAAGGAGSAAPAAGNSQQEKMKSCSADAKTKGLKGDDRKAFMKSCMSGNAAQ